MHIIPYKKIVIKHQKSKQEIYTIINNVTEPYQFLGNRGSSNIFCGECHSDSFKIMRIIRYRNSFLPVISGKIFDEKVVVTMRMSYLMTVFMFIWMVGAVVGFILSFLSITFSLCSGEFTGYDLLGLLLLPIGFFLMKLGFWKEVEVGEEELKNLINS